MIRPEHLALSLRRYLEVTALLESNRTYHSLNPCCEPQLGRRGLYQHIGGRDDGRDFELALLWVLNLSDGEHDLLAIAERSGAPFRRIADAAQALLAVDLLAEVAAPSSDDETDQIRRPGELLRAPWRAKICPLTGTTMPLCHTRPLPAASVRPVSALLLGRPVGGASALAVAQPTKKIVAFGDSMTVGLYDDGDDDCAPPNFGYPVRLSSRLTGQGIPNVVANEGLCGEADPSTGSPASTRRSTATPTPTAIVIMEGTNDLTNSGVGVETMVFNIHEMARKAQVRRAWPVVVAPPPRNPELGNSNARGFGYTEPPGWRKPRCRRTTTTSTSSRSSTPSTRTSTNITPPTACTSTRTATTWWASRWWRRSSWRSPGCGRPPACPTPAPCAWPAAATRCRSSGARRCPRWAPAPPSRSPPTPATSGSSAPSNIELVVKVLDGRAINGYYWVFYGALSDVEYTITVTDSTTGRQRIYKNPQGTLGSVGDIKAFAEPLP